MNLPALVRSPIVVIGSAVLVMAGVTAGLTRFVESDLSHQSRLINVSARGPIGTAPDAALVGFVIAERPQTVVVRARATAKGATGAEAIEDVTLRVVDNATGHDVGRNDHWRVALNERLKRDLKSLAPANPRHAACVLSLPPGGYSAFVEDRGGRGGVAAIEVFVVQD